MLIHSHRHSLADLGTWKRLARYDALAATAQRLDRRIERAVDALVAFAAAGPAYCGVSWGKDSVTVAHMVALYTSNVPIVWLRWEPWTNPDCVAVRDAFLARHPSVTYDEIEVRWTRGPDAEWVSPDPSDRDGFKAARDRHGPRHISGVRADESRVRRLRCARWGESSPMTCAPLARWSSLDVFAYLARYDLPIHPAYAMSFGGALPRDEIRVDALAGLSGTGRGRREWEWCYYRDEMAALGEDLRVLP
jgi:phosphoadenosine phosphosulfate reductase